MSQENNEYYESKATTVDEAVSEALLHLGARRDEVEIEVVEEGKGGLFGIIGRKQACVRVSLKTRSRRRGRRGGRGRGKSREEGAAATQAAPREDGRSREPRRRESKSEEPREEGRRRDGRGAARVESPRREREEPRRERGEPRREPRRESSPEPRNETAGETRRESSREPRRPRRERDDRPVREPRRAVAPAEVEKPAPAAVVEETPQVVETPVVVETSAPVIEEKTMTEAAPRPEPAAKPVPTGEPVKAAELVAPVRGKSMDDAPETQRWFAEELMRRSGFVSRSAVTPGDYNRVRITADSDSAAVLIGRRGFTVDALEHLVERMSAQALGGHVPMNLDINNYRIRQEGHLYGQASEAIDRVRSQGEPVHLPPMNPRDRRIIHLEVQDLEDLETYTTGEGYDRHVVVTKAGTTPAEESPSVPRETDAAPDESTD